MYFVCRRCVSTQIISWSLISILSPFLSFSVHLKFKNLFVFFLLIWSFIRYRSTNSFSKVSFFSFSFAFPLYLFISLSVQNEGRAMLIKFFESRKVPKRCYKSNQVYGYLTQKKKRWEANLIMTSNRPGPYRLYLVRETNVLHFPHLWRQLFLSPLRPAPFDLFCYYIYL